MKTIEPPLWKKKRVRFLCGVTAILAVVAVVLATRPSARTGTIPAGMYETGYSDGSERADRRLVQTEGFRMRATEVTVRQFVRFLNLTRPETVYDSPQISYSWGRYRAVTDPAHPVAFVTLDDARAYTTWLSRKKGVSARLPSSDEWEIAARGGVVRARYPWGWGPPHGRAHFDADGPARVARFAPNAYGLYDMAGNVAEWCKPDRPASAYAPARGGSWAERDPDQLRVFHTTLFPRDYRDADVGFRVLIE